MKKKIHVITVKVSVHIPVDPSSHASLDTAAGVIAVICAHAETVGFGTVIDSRLNRVTAPEPEPEPELPEVAPAENLDVPPNLRRTAEPKAAE
jgi:hypothetical protein